MTEFTNQNHEQSTGPKVETLVDATFPEARAYTIDGISLPDFDVLKSMPQFDTCSDFIFTRKGDERIFTARAKGDGTYHEDFEGLESIKSWAADSLDAMGIVAPKEGLRLSFRYKNLHSPVSEDFANNNYIHFDLGKGFFSLFQVDPTVIYDKTIQDAYPRDSINAKISVGDSKLAEYADMSVEDMLTKHKVVAPKGITTYGGPRTLHASPQLITGQMRPGILCFIDPTDPSDVNKMYNQPQKIASVIGLNLSEVFQPVQDDTK